MDTPLAVDTALTVLAAGLIFLWALALGIWKYHQMATSEDHLAHPYVDIAHRAALLYAFATMLLAVFVELSAWPDWVDLIAAAVVVAFFVLAIATYVVHGIRRDTTNQFERVDTTVRVAMAALIVGEIGGTAVLVAGFVAAQFF
ncbi:hypothetical protein MPNTM1_00912 [Mycolicibacterium parafortuitum]|uniref:hypothetical protein n=1 Tax=Mycolicibacterium parafortuitum TaxID=39692 RepID=UPI000CF2242D|nr:hypothetical protein CYL16_20425 [Mycobacterium sp. EPG1]